MKDIMDVMYLTGQRPIDVVKIHSSHIYNDLLHITQQKTGKRVAIKVIGKLKEIIDKRITEENQFLFTNKWGESSSGDRLQIISKTPVMRHQENIKS